MAAKTILEIMDEMRSSTGAAPAPTPGMSGQDAFASSTATQPSGFLNIPGYSAPAMPQTQTPNLPPANFGSAIPDFSQPSAMNTTAAPNFVADSINRRFGQSLKALEASPNPMLEKNPYELDLVTKQPGAEELYQKFERNREVIAYNKAVTRLNDDMDMPNPLPLVNANGQPHAVTPERINLSNAFEARRQQLKDYMVQSLAVRTSNFETFDRSKRVTDGVMSQFFPALKTLNDVGYGQYADAVYAMKQQADDATNEVYRIYSSRVGVPKSLAEIEADRVALDNAIKKAAAANGQLVRYLTNDLMAVADSLMKDGIAGREDTPESKAIRVASAGARDSIIDMKANTTLNQVTSELAPKNEYNTFRFISDDGKTEYLLRREPSGSISAYAVGPNASKTKSGVTGKDSTMGVRVDATWNGQPITTSSFDPKDGAPGAGGKTTVDLAKLRPGKHTWEDPTGSKAPWVRETSEQMRERTKLEKIRQLKLMPDMDESAYMRSAADAQNPLTAAGTAVIGGMGDVLKGLAGGVEMLLPGKNTTALREWMESAGDKWQRSPKANDTFSPEWFYEESLRQVPQLLLSWGTAAIASKGGQAVSWAGRILPTFLQEGGNAYVETKRRLMDGGMSDADSSQQAMFQGMSVGVVNSIVEQLPISTFLNKKLPGFNEKFINNLSKKMPNFLKVGTQEALAEGITEAIQEAVPDFVQYMGEGDASAFNNAIERWLAAGALGATSGGGAGATIQAAQDYLERSQRMTAAQQLQAIRKLPPSVIRSALHQQVLQSLGIQARKSESDPTAGVITNIGGVGMQGGQGQGTTPAGYTATVRLSDGSTATVPLTNQDRYAFGAPTDLVGRQVDATGLSQPIPPAGGSGATPTNVGPVTAPPSDNAAAATPQAGSVTPPTAPAPAVAPQTPAQGATNEVQEGQTQGQVAPAAGPVSDKGGEVSNPPPSSPAPTKEPWQMTQKEYIALELSIAERGVGKLEDGAEKESFSNGAAANHYAAIKKAVEEGKEIPDAVLTDYPDLATEIARRKTGETFTPIENRGVQPGQRVRIKTSNGGESIGEYLGEDQGSMDSPNDVVAVLRQDNGNTARIPLRRISSYELSSKQTQGGQKKGQAKVGVNAYGQDIFEDENGVRSYVENGVRVTEPVAIGPRGEKSVNKERRRDSFKTTEEVEAAKPKAAPAKAKRKVTIKQNAPVRELKDKANVEQKIKSLDAGATIDRLDANTLSVKFSGGMQVVVQVAEAKGISVDELRRAWNDGNGTESYVKSIRARVNAITGRTVSDEEITDFINEGGEAAQTIAKAWQPKGEQVEDVQVADADGNVIMDGAQLVKLYEGAADAGTIFHELVHAMFRANLLTKAERDVIINKFQKDGKFDEEAAVKEFTRLHKDRQGQNFWEKAIVKVVKFLDKVVGVRDEFTRATDAVVSGEVFKRPAKKEEDNEAAKLAEIRRRAAEKKKAREQAKQTPAAPAANKPEPPQKPQQQNTPPAKPQETPKATTQPELSSEELEMLKELQDYTGKFEDPDTEDDTQIEITDDLLRTIWKGLKGFVARGKTQFSDFVKIIATAMPKKVRALADTIEAAWDMYREDNPDAGLSETGSVRDILMSKKGAQDAQDGTNQSDGNVPGGESVSGGATGAPSGDAAGNTGGDGKGGVATGSPSQDGKPGASSESQTDGTGGQPGGSGGTGAGSGSGGTSGATATGSDPRSGKGGTRSVKTLQEQIADRRADLPVERRNHRVAPSDTLIPGGPKARIDANIAAIRLYKQLIKDGRNATPAEKQVLAKYVGWGHSALAALFDRTKISLVNYSQKYNTQLEADVLAWKEKNWANVQIIKDLLTEDEWDAAARSTRNAHYTDRSFITEGLWRIATHLGFKGGYALENSAGIGHVIGLIPDAIEGKTQWTAVEMDDLSSGILKLLYPEARIYRSGFQDAPIENGSADLNIGNVPFAADGPNDDRYPNFSLHNYMLARAIDTTAPGGLVIEITSASTMDNDRSQAFREWAAERVDLVGAIRLPNNAFKQNAGTEVTTDILIFRKRDGRPFGHGNAWTTTREVTVEPPSKWDAVANGPAPTSVFINEYFVQNPHMMLGSMSLEGTMYGPAQPALIVNDGQDTIALLREAVDSLPGNIVGSDAKLARTEKTALESSGGKPFSYQIRNGRVYQVDQTGKNMVDPEWMDGAAGLKKEKIAKNLIAIREQANSLISQELSKDATDEEIEASRQNLNNLYDAFIKDHGRINSRENRNIFGEDPEFQLIASLEYVNDKWVEKTDENGTIIRSMIVEMEKADIMKRRANRPVSEPTSAENVTDALSISESWRGYMDVDYIAKLLKKDKDAVIEDMLSAGLAYRDPDNAGNVFLVSKMEYLSGDVRAKLRAAEERAKTDDRYKANVEALKMVIPTDVPVSRINLRIGSPWIPAEMYEAWINHLFGVRSGQNAAKVRYIPEIGQMVVDWHDQLKNATVNTSKHGAGGKSATWILDHAFSLSVPTVQMQVPNPDPNGKPLNVLDPKNTDAVRQKLEQFQNEFDHWLKTSKYANDMARIYNDTFNSNVPRQYPQSIFKYLPGQSEAYFSLRPHQAAAVSRGVRESYLLAHEVGTGKTMTFIATAMEMRRLGLARKPMIVALNANIGQIVETFKKMYPQARILFPTPKDFEAENRQRLFARIATNEYDAVIVAHSQFNQIEDDPDRLKAWIRAELAKIEEVLKDTGTTARRKKGKKDSSTKELEAKRDKLKERLKKLLDRKTDNTITFEKMGIDALIVDEAHYYKKVYFDTQMSNVRGLDTSFSERGLGLLMKSRWVQERTGNRNVILSTGTPVTNTLAESWNVMRVIRPDLMAKWGISNFDDFVGTFALIKASAEMDSVGRWKDITRMSRFNNAQQLSQMFRQIADVAFADDIEQISRPNIIGGGPQDVEIRKGRTLKRIMNDLLAQYEWYESLRGKDKVLHRYVPLVVMTNSRKAALDVRMINPQLPAERTSKLESAAQNIFERWKKTEADKGVQVVFSDLYRSKEEDDPDAGPRFNLFDALRDRLIELGIPKEQIASVVEKQYTSSSKVSQARRAKLFDDTNEGKVRVIMGTTDKLGVGVNIQARLYALHHLDAPHRPSDIEQREGRINRQGNLYSDEGQIGIEILRYGVKGTADAGAFQRLARKQKMIREFIGGKLSENSVEDVEDDGSMSFEQAAAAFSGDPLTLRRFELTKDVQRLENIRAAYIDSIAGAREKIKYAKSSIADYLDLVTKTTKWKDEHSDVQGGHYVPITINGTTYTNSADFIAAIEPMMAAGMAQQEAFYKDPATRTQRGTSYEITFPVAQMKVGSVVVNLRSVSRPGSMGDMREPAHFAYEFKAPWGGQLSGLVQSDAIHTSRGLLSSMSTTLAQASVRIEQYEKHIENQRGEIAQLEEVIATPFENEAELRQFREELKLVVDAIEETQGRFTYTKEEQDEFNATLSRDIGSDWTQKITLPDVRRYINDAQLPTKMLAWFDRQTIVNEDAFTWVEQELERQREYASKNATVKKSSASQDSPLPRREGIQPRRRPNTFTGETGAMQQRVDDDNPPSFQAPADDEVDELMTNLFVPQRNVTDPVLAEREAKELESDDPDVEARMKASHLVGPDKAMSAWQTAKQIVKEHKWGNHYANTIRGVDAEFQNAMRIVEASWELANKKAINFLDRLLTDMSPNDYTAFSRLIILGDAIRFHGEQTEQGHANPPLPFGYEDIDAVQRDFEKQSAYADKYPKIWDKVRQRDEFIKDLARQQVELGLLEAKVLEDEWYFHRIIVQHAQQRLNDGTLPGKPRNLHETKESHQRHREGSDKDYVTQYHISEYELITRSIQSIEKKIGIDKVESLYDRSRMFRQEARKKNEIAIHGGSERYNRMMALRAEVEAIREAGDSPDPAIMAELADLDVLKPFRTRMAIAFSKMAKALKDGNAPQVPAEFEAEADALVAQSGRKGDQWYEVNVDLDTMKFLSWWSKQDHPTASLPLMLFKAVRDRESFIRESLGKEYFEWQNGSVDPRIIEARKDDTGDDYVLWQPKEGNYIFTVETLTQEALRKIQKGVAPTEADMRQLLAMGGQRKTWVIPSRIAYTLDNMKPMFDANNALVKASVGMTTLWKRYILTMPLRFLKYNLNNMMSDIDVVLAYDPRILKYAPKALSDLLAERKGGTVSDDIYEATRGGVIGGGMTIQELPDLNHMHKLFRELSGTPESLFQMTAGRYMEWTSETSQLRENVMRLAAYRYFKDQIAKGKKVYGASVKENVDAAKRPAEKAALLARDLLGDYGGLSVGGQRLRRFLMPFYSWTEINAPRYYRMLMNMRHEGKGASGMVARKTAGTIAKVGVKTAWKTGLLAMGAIALMGLMELWNRMMFPDDDERMKAAGYSGYLILGRTDDGMIMSIRLATALRDAAELFGIDRAFRNMDDVIDDKITVGEALKQSADQSASRFINQINPVVKTGGEIIVGETIFPSVRNPRNIRDPIGHAAGMVAMRTVWENMNKIPTRPGQWWKEAFFTLSDPGEEAFHAVRNLRNKWEKKVGKESPEIGESTKSTAMFYHLKAKKFGDEKLAAYWKEQYHAAGGTNKGYNQSIDNRSPLGGMKLQDRVAFIKTLTPAEAKLLSLAEEWHKGRPNPASRPASGEAAQ